MATDLPEQQRLVRASKICQSCFAREATTAIELSVGPLLVCDGCDAEWLHCLGVE